SGSEVSPARAPGEEQDAEDHDRDRPDEAAGIRHPDKVAGDRRAADHDQQPTEDRLPAEAAPAGGPDGRDADEGDAQEQRSPTLAADQAEIGQRAGQAEGG